MAKLTKTAFVAKWNAIFVDNLNGDITPAVFRNWLTDFKDSFLSEEDIPALPDITDAVNLKHDHKFLDLNAAISKAHEHNQTLNSTDDVEFNTVSVGGEKVLDSRYSSPLTVIVVDGIIAMVDNSGGAPSATRRLDPTADNTINANFATIAAAMNVISTKLGTIIDNQTRTKAAFEHHGLISNL
jgi:hypothetical protein